MSKPVILCVDDQRDVLAAVVKDLAPFATLCEIVDCESTTEARTQLADLHGRGQPLAVIVSDHIMPDENGIDFLADLAHDTRYEAARRVLVTGLATQQDTIRAINQARIDRYIEKPWATKALVEAVKEALTLYVVHNGLDYMPLIEVLDQPTLYRLLAKKSK